MMQKEKIRADYRKRGRRKCQHCKTYKISKPKSLCWRCHTNTAIRDLYPSMKMKCNNRGFGLANTTPPPPAERTSAPPGSPRKLKVMSARMKAGRSPCHPDDSLDWEEATDDDRREFAAQQSTGLGRRSTRAELEAMVSEGAEGEDRG